MAIQGIPTLPVFAAYAKSKMPEITDQEILKLYDAYGRDVDAQEAPAPRAPVQQPAPVQVPAQSQLLPTTVDPFKGTTQAAANPAAPNASAISQFDPAARDAALEEYKRLYDQSAPVREQSMQRAAVAAVGSPAAGQLARESWLDLDKENLRRSIDQQVGKEAQATAGQAVLTSAQAREEAAGKFAGTQREQQQKLELAQFTVEQQKRLNDPNSAETRAAKSLLLSQIQNIPSAAQVELRGIINDPGVTAVSLLPILQQYAPAAHKAYLDQIGAGKTEAEGKKAAAEAAGMTQSQNIIGNRYGVGSGTPAGTPPVQAPAPAGTPPVQAPGPAGTPPVQAPAPAQNTGWNTNKFGPQPSAQEIDPLEISSVSGTSGATLSQRPELTAKRDAGYKQVDRISNFIQDYNRTAAPAVRSAFQNTDRYGGVKAVNTVNYQNAADTAEYKNNINKLNAVALELGIITPSDNKAAQSATSAIGSAVSATGNPYAAVAGTALAAASPFIGTGQAVTNLSDPKLVKDLATKVEIAKAQMQKLLPEMQELGGLTRYGMMDKFTQTPIYKEVMSSIPVQNPVTGEIVLINPNSEADRQEAARLQKEGWQPRKGYIGNVR